jgi:hypothetical protein
MQTIKGFDLVKIESSLKNFQANFIHINDKLEMRREEFTDVIVGNLLEGYDFLNSLWAKKIDLFSLSGLYNMLELNHIVLCGTDPKVRKEFYTHLDHTRTRFQEKIRPIYKWYKKYHEKLGPYKIVGEYYGRALSFPQLFFEGNHRTENMIVNYFLLNRGLPAYIISVDSAVDYLNVSGRIKFSMKEKFSGDIQRIKHTKGFRKFLKEHGSLNFYSLGKD